jgi:hypothetical protein
MKGYTANTNEKIEARIGFIISYPFQFHVLKNIYKHLKIDSEFIVDTAPFFPVKQPDDLIQSIVSLLEKNNVPYKIASYDNYKNQEHSSVFFEKYEVLVSLWEFGCLGMPCNNSKKKVRIGYGSGKELTMYRPSGRIFDFALAYGPRDNSAFSLFCESNIVGVPKFDDWFNGNFDKDLIKDLSSHLNTLKKTILYLPTHSDLCSIEQLAPGLKALTSTYNVITKLHYLNLTDQPELVEHLKGGNILLFSDDADLLTLLKVSDVVLSDNSSAIFDAMLADKPIVVTDFLTKDFLDYKHKEVRNYRRGNTSALTYSGSMEQLVKQEKLVVSFQDPNKLEEAIKEGLRDDIFYKKNRTKINQELVGFQDGNCGERAAKEIERIKELTTLPTKPPMAHALDVYDKKMKFQEGLTSSKIEYQNWLYENTAHSGKVFTVVVFDLFGGNIKETMQSLYNQNFSRDAYDVVVLTENQKVLNSSLIKYIYVKENIGTTLSDFLASVNSSFVCFTTAGTVVPNDWLINFFKQYKNNMDVVGVGGYSLPKEIVSIFDECENFYFSERVGMQFSQKSTFYQIKSTLLYKNPACEDPSNTSYRVDFVRKLPGFFTSLASLNGLFLCLKQFAVRDGGYTTFDGVYVIRPGIANFKKYLFYNYEVGLNYFFITKIKQTSMIKMIFSSFFYTISIRKRIIFTAIIFLGELFRIVGRIHRWSLGKSV